MAAGRRLHRDDDVVIVEAVRTPVGRARRGSFKDTSPDDLLHAVLVAIRERTGIDPALVEDVAVGNVQLAGSYALPARTAMLRAGYPYTTPIYSLNRQCSSGLQAVANIAASIAAGDIRIGIAAGVESMSVSGGPGEGEMPPMNGDAIGDHPLASSCLTPMGITAENVAERYGVSREAQDAMAVSSHSKALAAQASGAFEREIVPVTVSVVSADGGVTKRVVTHDDGPRPGTSMEGLAKLKPVFRPEGGSVTAGTSSQVRRRLGRSAGIAPVHPRRGARHAAPPFARTLPPGPLVRPWVCPLVTPAPSAPPVQVSDGAAAVLLMSRSTAASLGLSPLGCLRSYRVVGVPPDEMGVGPAVAVPAALRAAEVEVGDVDVFEINEVRRKGWKGRDGTKGWRMGE
jgi:acetyl-CoA acyltransferase 1